jgi:hypothetical protein
MTLAAALILAPLLTAFLAGGATTFWWHDRVIVLLKTRHPQVWGEIDGPPFSSRQAFGHFMRSRGDRRLDDPELSRAVDLALWSSWLLLAIGAALFAAVCGLRDQLS